MELLFDIVMILALAGAMVFVCHHVRLPTVVAFLLTGVAIGPHGFGLIHDVHEVEVLAEVGVILLLFIIGLEFSIGRLLSMRRLVLGGGALQIGLTTIIVAPVANVFLGNPKASVFFGFLIALSSTAIVLKLIQERGEIEAPHGKTALAILIFQDVAVVPMMLMVPFLAGQSADLGRDVLMLVARFGAVVLLVAVAARWVAPKLLHAVASTRNQELFQLVVLVVCFAVAWGTQVAGLSLALGAFLAGLVVSESEYSHQAVANVLPFRDVFASFFFISIGMLLNLQFVAANAPQVVLAFTGVVVVKALVICAVGLVLGFSLRNALLAALALCQVGEFSFVLYRSSAQFGLLSTNAYQFFLTVTILTMLAAPAFMAFGPRFADLVLRLPLPAFLVKGLYMAREEQEGKSLESLQDHLVIVGFGLTGRHLATAAGAWSIPYVVIELNPQTVRQEQAKGRPIFYGDASKKPILEHAGIERAKVVAIAIPDPVYVRRVTRVAKELNPGAHFVVRTRFFSEYSALKELGADEVVPEEYETSIEVFSRVLARYSVPREDILRFVNDIRTGGYDMFRQLPPAPAELCEYTLPNVEIRRMTVREGAPADGATPGGLELRKSHGLTLLTIRRKDGSIVSNPGADTHLEAGDVLLCVGRNEDLFSASALFRGKAKNDPRG
ncbi:MAG: cation:proton antiporter [Desulfatibacillaceae bacterium]